MLIAAFVQVFKSNKMCRDKDSTNRPEYLTVSRYSVSWLVLRLPRTQRFRLWSLRCLP